MLYLRFLLALSFTTLLLEFGFGATLPKNEVQALRDIAKTLNKSNWDFNVDPCSGSSGWVDRNQPTEDSVTCDCSFDKNTTCRVVSITLKSQNLSGTLPDLGGLPYLQIIDLTRNYLSGNIPSAWGSTKLVTISLLGNRLTGQIPKEIGNITTLNNLTVEHNQLSGDLPQELGNLTNLQRLLLTSNNFTGQLPNTLAKLTTLTDFRISDNPFSGQIPSFIQNFANLQNLIIQGTNMSGPIPTGIGRLRSLTDLRISDLTNSTESEFPPLNNLKNLKILILRSCNLVGSIPNYIGQLTSLNDLLDLSFNKLTGGFPSSFFSIASIKYLYLSGNMLNGSIPDYIYQKGNDVDLSYNNFSTGTACSQGTLNLFASSSMSNVSKTVSCLQSYKCSKMYYSMNINCGGKATTVHGITYDDDTDTGGPSRFYQSPTNWAYSNTGNFIDDNTPTELYIQTNTTPLSAKASSLYLDARISPISLTYYGFCLGNGSYTVHLQFAEIRFTGDRSYMSLGRRIFDVYIQGKRVLKDFNIENEVGGVGVPLIRNFSAVVDSNTLEIRFYWAGKGTNAIPVRGVFGPLISAISVTPNFPTPSEGSSSISKPAIIGIVIAAVAVISLFLGFLWWICCVRQKYELATSIVGVIVVCSLWWRSYKKNNQQDQRIRAFLTKSGPLPITRYRHREIKKMTGSYRDKLGEGGFGTVFKGKLADGRLVAVKVLKESKRVGEDFINEVASISCTSHVNIVTLLGFCFDGTNQALVYEFMPNGSLEKYIRRNALEVNCLLTWEKLHEIAVGIAQGLEYLHRGCNTRILHFDIKPHNILLDEKLCPKISDFGLAKICPDRQSIISFSGARGTAGYIAPEVFYRNFGGVSHKSDVYSYGMLVLEMAGIRSKEIEVSIEMDSCSDVYFPDWIYKRIELGKGLGLPGIDSEVDGELARRLVIVSLWCIQTRPSDRPPMSRVIEMLRPSFQPLVIPPRPFLHSLPRSHHSQEVNSSSISMVHCESEPALRLL